MNSAILTYVLCVIKPCTEGLKYTREQRGNACRGVHYAVRILYNYVFCAIFCRSLASERLLADSAPTQVSKLSIEHSSSQTHSSWVGNQLTKHRASCSLQSVVSTILPAERTADIFDRFYKQKYLYILFTTSRLPSLFCASSACHSPFHASSLVGMFVMYFIHMPQRLLRLAFVFSTRV